MKVIVIGAGPGGYEAAIKAAKLGADVTIIEKDKFGGTCLNRGCIPTKSLLKSSEILSEVRHAGTFGIEVEGEGKADFAQVIARKDKIVSQLVKGIEFLLNKNRIKIVKGFGKLLDKHTVEVEGEGFRETLEADKIILATGSVPVCPGIFKYDGKKVITSDEVLSLQEAPKSIIIVGGGVIGCEIGQFLRRMGSEVTIVEMMPHILPLEDEDVAKQLERQFKKDKIKVIAGQGITSVEVEADGVTAYVGDKQLKAEKLLVSIGRKPYTEGLGLENVGIKLDNKGRIIVNEKMETSVEGIYAIGDVVPGAQLAHLASAEAECAVENIMGNHNKMDYQAVPRGVFTDPEVSGVGLTEEEAIAKGYSIKKGDFAFRGLGKAQAMGQFFGKVKVISDEKTDKLLGASIIGPHATDIIHELAVGVKYGLTAKQLGRVIHSHPTLSEAVMEALQDVNGQSAHKV